MHMTREKAEEWISRLETPPFNDDAYRPSIDLSLVLRLELHSHLKPSEIYKLTRYDVERKIMPVTHPRYIPKEGNGKYSLENSKRYIYTTPEDYNLCIHQSVELMKKENNANPERKLVAVSGRALRYKFQNMVNFWCEHKGETERPEIIDFYYAGLDLTEEEDRHKSMRRN